MRACIGPLNNTSATMLSISIMPTLTDCDEGAMRSLADDDDEIRHRAIESSVGVGESSVGTEATQEVERERSALPVVDSPLLRGDETRIGIQEESLVERLRDSSLVTVTLTTMEADESEACAVEEIISQWHDEASRSVSTEMDHDQRFQKDTSRCRDDYMYVLDSSSVLDDPQKRPCHINSDEYDVTCANDKEYPAGMHTSHKFQQKEHGTSAVSEERDGKNSGKAAVVDHSSGTQRVTPSCGRSDTEADVSPQEHKHLKPPPPSSIRPLARSISHDRNLELGDNCMIGKDLNVSKMLALQSKASSHDSTLHEAVNSDSLENHNHHEGCDSDALGIAASGEQNVSYLHEEAARLKPSQECTAEEKFSARDYSNKVSTKIVGVTSKNPERSEIEHEHITTQLASKQLLESERPEASARLPQSMNDLKSFVSSKSSTRATLLESNEEAKLEEVHIPVEAFDDHGRAALDAFERDFVGKRYVEDVVESELICVTRSDLPDFKDQVRRSDSRRGSANTLEPTGNDVHPIMVDAVLISESILAEEAQAQRQVVAHRPNCHQSVPSLSPHTLGSSGIHPLPLHIEPQEQSRFEERSSMASSTESQKRRKRLSRCLYIFITAILSMGAVSGAFCASGNCSDNSKTQNRVLSVTTFINFITFSSEQIVYPGGTTSEAMALEWLIKDDPLQLSAETEVDQFRLQQRYALLTLWFQSIPELWRFSSGWGDAVDECDWFGVSCTKSYVGKQAGNQAVVSDLNFYLNNMHGRIPSDIALLTSLRSIDLKSNRFSGTLPSSLGTIAPLETLDVSSNFNLEGSLPSSLTDLTNLVRLSAFSCALTGTLPESMDQWTSLESFGVASNRLSGSIPESIAGWSSVQRAYLHDNLFEGPIPDAVCDTHRWITLTANCEINDCPCCTECCSEMNGANSCAI